MVLSTVKNHYHYLFTELGDKRTNDWLLLKSPLPSLIIVGCYMYFVLSWGPKFMKNRKPFQLKKTLLIYNLFQVMSSIHLVIESQRAWFFHYSWKCEPMDYSYSPVALRVVAGFHFFHLAKLTELLDTVFFILRKNDRQVTFLHIYHHILMALTSWILAKYVPGGQGIFVGAANSIVHTIMYTYYLLAALGSEFQKYLWWKKYITKMQMIQFVLIFAYTLQILYYDCGYPKWPLLVILPNAVFFFYLFKEFYNKTYEKRTVTYENGYSKKIK